ncbi:MAG: hypothetical protein HY716_16350 [Planctomycetes bacterium]|nr:hypothetical protein [Planctomycetota bacterium]
MSRRFVLILTGLYFLQATWLLHGSMDLLFPRVREVIAGPDSCCAGACGCPEEVARRKGCCCFPSPEHEASEPARRPVSSIEEARCRGLETTMSQTSAHPAIAGFVRPARYVPETRENTLDFILPNFWGPSSPPDKVPIA